MKKTGFFVGFCVIALAIGLGFAGCDLGAVSGNSDAEPLILTGTSNGKALMIIITQGNSSRAVLTPKGGENYQILLDNVLVSKGTLSVSGSDWTFKPAQDSPNKYTATAVFSGGTLSSLTVPDTTISNGRASTTGSPSGGNNNDDSFVAVTNIIDVPATGTPGTALTLTGTVVPATATNKTIAWTVKSPATGVTITGNVLTAASAGTVVVTATIVNGTARGTNYTKDFNITIAAFVPVTGITGVPTTGTAGVNLSLTGTVAPAAATNKTITWTVKSAGTTGAVIAAGTNVLETTAAGTVTVTAAIPNGTAAGTNYTQDFTITIGVSGGTPTATPAGGVYTSARSVTLSTTTSGATIYYTVNGAVPTTSSTQYTGPVTISATTTLKAIAVKAGMDNSAVLTVNYYIASGSVLPLGNGMYIRDFNDNGGVVVEMKSDPKQYDLNAITKKLYTVFADIFDSIILVMDNDEDFVTEAGAYGINYGVSNTVTGLGISQFDNTADWGSDGYLKSVMLFPYRGGIGYGPGLHEYAHNWAAYVVPTFGRDNEDYSGHWGVSNAGGQLGGFKYVRVVEENVDGVPGKTKYQGSRSEDKNVDGSFKSGFGLNANGGNGLPYSDIELYLMGMKSAAELRAKNFTLDIYTGISTDESCFDSNGNFNGYFYATGITSYTVDDLITSAGERIPSAANSQKVFKVLTVFVSEDNSPDEYYQLVAGDIKWFANMQGYENRYSFYNFSRATGGVGSLEISGLKNSLK